MNYVKGKMIGLVALFVLALSVLVPVKASAADTKCSMDLWIGDKQVVNHTNVTYGEEIDYYSFKLGLIYKDDNYKVYGQKDGDEINTIYIRPLGEGGDTITIPGIRAVGSGDVKVLGCIEETGDIFKDTNRRIKLVLDAYSVDAAWKGYSFYSEFFTDEEGGRPSDKITFSITDGAYRTGEGSTALIKGTIKCTSFSTDDMLSIDFGTAEKPLDNALEMIYRQKNNEEWDRDSYYQLENKGAKITAYVTGAFMKPGKYLEGRDEKEVTYKLILMWDEGELKIIDKDGSSDMLAGVEKMRVMTGGKITLKSDSEIKAPKAQSGYYSQVGEILVLPKDCARTIDATINVDCVVDTKENEHADTVGRYTYTVSDDKKEIVLASTTKTLNALGVEAEKIKNGHFQIEAGTGIKGADKEEYWFEEGTIVKFTLVPDAGYQYKKGSFSLLGENADDSKYIHKTDDPGVYYYEMEGGHATNVCCEFEPAKDEIEVESKAVTEASIDMGKNSLIGSMEFSVDDAKDVPTEVTEKINEASNGLTVDSVLDLSLTQKIEAISGEDAWETNISELEDKMTVSLALDDSVEEAEEYTIIRVHDGVAEAIETTYDEKTGTVSFETDKYSTYAIAYKQLKTNKLTVKKTSYSLNASTKAQTITLSATAKEKSTKITYASDNKSVKVSSKGVITVAKNFSGKATITVTATKSGYKKIVKTVTVTVKPAKVEVKKLTTSKKALTVSWAKNSYVKGYEIQYSTSSKFTAATTKTVKVASNKTTSKKISKLTSGKTYYVRIRTYSVTGKDTVTSAWSKTAKLKVK